MNIFISGETLDICLPSPHMQMSAVTFAYAGIVASAPSFGRHEKVLGKAPRTRERISYGIFLSAGFRLRNSRRERKGIEWGSAPVGEI